jgi:NitT/TauT family transport system substrate-binding protein
VRRNRWVWGIVVLVLAGAVAGTAGATTRTARAQQSLRKVTLQLPSVTRAQFAGYYEAQAKGFYKAAGLDVTIKPGGSGIFPEQAVAHGQAQFGVDWLSSLMLARAQGVRLVSIAQVFDRSGLALLTWKNTGLDSIAKLRHKKVANWLFGKQFEVFAALERQGMDPAHNKGVTIVQQPPTMDFFLHRQVDAASAMTYDELAQVLESKNPSTGKLYTLKDLNVIKMQKIGTGVLEDNIFTSTHYLKKAANRATAQRFIAASLRGWIYCRDHQAACVKTVLANGKGLGRGHQRWMMNEVNALIWPAPKGIGIIDPRAFKRSAKIVATYGQLPKVPGHEAYRTDLAAAALAGLKRHNDVHGRRWHKLRIRVTPGGK